MENLYANRVSELEPSAVYDILKYTIDGKVIAFAAGNPAPEAIPSQAIAELSKEVILKNPIMALQYGQSQGYAPLRQQIMEYLSSSQGLLNKNDDIIITCGATQAIELVAKVFCNENDTIICENPTFIGSLSSFRSYALNILGVSLEDDGINLGELEQTLKNNKNIRFIYTIPNFHNPAGVTMSLQKRKSLYNLAVKYNTFILEDDPYGSLRYMGEHIPSIKSMDQKGIVLYVGSFSKIISPGLRVGYILLDKEHFSKFTITKQASDVHTPLLNQMIVHQFMKQYGLDNHIQKICNIYRNKLQLTLDSLEKHLGNKISYVKPQGGLYIYCKLPDNIDMMEYWQACLDAGVATVFGSAFLINKDDKTQYFRINFSTPTDDQLLRGIKILGDVFDKMSSL